MEEKQQSQTSPSEPPEEEESRVFGLPRMCFYGIAFGVAGGYILSGVIGLLTGKTPSVSICAVLCGAAGYFIAGIMQKKKKNTKN